MCYVSACSPPSTPPPEASLDSEHLIVDGMNVIGSRPDGWWRDRDAAVRRLAADLGRLAADGTPVSLVLDGRPLPDLPAGRHDGVEVHYGGHGRDAADDRIVELLEEQTPAAQAGTQVIVVTADRMLRVRVQALGAAVIGPSALRRRLQAPAADEGSDEPTETAGKGLRRRLQPGEGPSSME